MIINGSIYYKVEIQRLECQRLGHLKPKHKTFSLLPHQAIPYHQHDLDQMLATAQYNAVNNIEDTKKYITKRNDISLEHSQINELNNIMNEAFLKLTSIDNLSNMIKNSNYFNSKNPVETVINFVKYYHSNTVLSGMPNIEQLSLDYFYHFQNEQSYFNRHFLFGTPSQKRLKLI